MAYVPLVFLDLALALAIVGLTAAAAHALLDARDGGGPVPRRVLPLLAGALAVLVARASTAIALGSIDVAFAERRVVGLPLVAVLLLLALATRSPLPTVAACAAAVVAVVDVLVVPSPVWLALLAVLALAGPALLLGGRAAPHLRAGLLAVPLVLLVLAVGASWWTSRLPGTFDMGAYAAADLGGGSASAEGAHAGHGTRVAVAVASTGTSVTALTGPQNGKPDARFVLTAGQAAENRLAFNGTIPGPALEVTQGDLVEVVLRNADVEQGVSVHWHGVDVPNAEDGVAGVTQDAVAPGGSHTYRFVAEQAGTYWYHSHQLSSEQVAKGLYGALVVQPARADTGTDALDVTVMDHAWRGPQGFTALGRYDEDARLERLDAPPGTPVRLRLVNTDSAPHRYRVDGAAYRVVAVDGTDLVEPTPVDRHDLRLAGGGRYDVTFEMPAGPVTVHGLGGGHRLLLGTGEPSTGGDQPLLDLASYGSPAQTPFDAASAYDRDFVLDIDRRVRFQDGRLGWQWTVNGESYPRMPMLVVREGELVRTTIVNRSTATHPMHLHGHHVLVLERNGEPVTGSPWWSDTLDVAPGERYVVAFRADNPGIWMDHCHDLGHAADGFVLHLAYEGVRTPFQLGGAAGNTPE